MNNVKTLITVTGAPITQAQIDAIYRITMTAEPAVAIYSPANPLPALESAVTVISEDSSLSLAVEAEHLVVVAPIGATPDDKLLNSYLGCGAKRVSWIHEDGVYRDAPAIADEKAKPNMLFIFPGPIVPLNLGSHQRAFNLLRNLQACGHVVDVLVPQSANQAQVESALRCYANNVYFYKNTKRKYRWPQRFMRGIDKRWRKVRGLGGALPDLYSERARNKPVESAARMATSLYLANQYSFVLVSYAWMMNVLRYLSPFRDRFRVVCDTHDVQFYRNLSDMGRFGRLFSSTSKQKALEIKHLNQADAVLAISESDQLLLRKALPGSRVSRVSPGFDYAASTLKRRPHNLPVNFGFIGGSMAANVQAVSHIVEHWWPAIREFSPESKLFIAGSVSNNEAIRQLTFFDENIVKLGFVDDLADFYKKIDVSVNPVLVAGGLNFKSVEAVFYGKHLLTNPLGKKCLGDGFPCEVIEGPEQIAAFVRTIERDANDDLANRRRLQSVAVEMFGNKRACKDIVSHLSFVA